MSELLTTGAMIDRLKIGEIAESQDGTQAKKDQFYSIVVLKNGEKDGMFLTNSSFLNKKWRILPNYVSFEEAMKALKDGYNVTLHLEDGGYTSFNEADKVKFLTDDVTGITFSELCLGKWTIEND